MTVLEAAAGSDRFPLAVIGAAAGLGLFAFVADLVEGMAGQVLVAVTSSGFTWGLAAYLIGTAAKTSRRAAVGGAALLASATVVYYALILFVSRRWSGAYLADGAPADLSGLRSVALMTGVWLVGSVAAGPLLALLGQVTRSCTTARAAVATGVACGLLSGDGWSRLLISPPWLLPLDDPYRSEFVHGIVASQIVLIAAPLAVLVWLTVARRLWSAWPALVTATIACGALSTMLWYALSTTLRGGL